MYVGAWKWGNHIFVNTLQWSGIYFGRTEFIWNYSGDDGARLSIEGIDCKEVDPFIYLERIGNAYTRTVKHKIRNPQWSRGFGIDRDKDRANNQYIEFSAVDGYFIERFKELKECYDVNVLIQNYKNQIVAFNCVNFYIIFDDKKEPITLRFERPDAGELVIDSESLVASNNFLGRNIEWRIRFPPPGSPEGLKLADMHKLLQTYTFKEGELEGWNWFFSQFDTKSLNEKGIARTKKQKDIAVKLAWLEVNNPVLFEFFNYLHSATVYDNITNNQLLSMWLKKRGRKFELIKRDLEKALFAIKKLDKIEAVGQTKLETRHICLRLKRIK